MPSNDLQTQSPRPFLTPQACNIMPYNLEDNIGNDWGAYEDVIKAMIEVGTRMMIPREMLVKQAEMVVMIIRLMVEMF